MHKTKRYLFHSIVHGTRELALGAAGLLSRLGVGLLLVAAAQAQTLEVSAAPYEAGGSLLHATTSLPQLEVDLGAGSLLTTTLTRPQAPSDTNPSQDAANVRIYLLWGQSHMEGSGEGVLGLAGTGPYWATGAPYQAIPNCYIFDKIKRGNSLQREYFDSTPGHLNERPQLRPMTIGYAWGANYPWDPGLQVADPRVGPETSMAEYVHEKTGDIVVIVKMAVGGTLTRNLDTSLTCGCNNTFLGARPTWNVDSSTLGSNNVPPYLHTMLRNYWYPAVTLTKAKFPTRKVYLGGVISLIGSSDTPCPNVFEADYTEIINLVRMVLGGANASQVPYLVVQSPLFPGSTIPPCLTANLDFIRTQQANIPVGMPNVDPLDADQFISAGAAGVNNHAHAKETIELGKQFGIWASDLMIPLLQL